MIEGLVEAVLCYCGKLFQAFTLSRGKVNGLHLQSMKTGLLIVETCMLSSYMPIAVIDTCVPLLLSVVDHDSALEPLIFKHAYIFMTSSEVAASFEAQWGECTFDDR